MLNFSNTEIAFRSKSNADLKKAYWLFKSLSVNSMVSIGKGLTNFALGFKLPVNWVVKPTIYSHFVGGESIEECLPVVEKLQQFNVKAILDYSVEGHSSGTSIQNTMDETLKAIGNAIRNSNIPFAVFKPTAFTRTEILEKVSSGSQLQSDEQREASNFRDRVNTLCNEAFKGGKPILIDAEDFAFQKFIDEVIFEMMKKYNKDTAIVYNTFQMYRSDRLEFLKHSFNEAVDNRFVLGAKFVRGAYMDKERERAQKMGYASPIQPDKESTDRDYNEALKFCIENIGRVHVFNGTHNEFSCNYLTELMTQHNLAKNDYRVYTSQLYGMSDHISFNMAIEGYNVAKYLPYGPVKHVLPYLIRRAEENTSVKGQTGRELGLLLTEINRRKLS